MCIVYKHIYQFMSSHILITCYLTKSALVKIDLETSFHWWIVYLSGWYEWSGTNVSSQHIVASSLRNICTFLLPCLVQIPSSLPFSSLRMHWHCLALMSATLPILICKPNSSCSFKSWLWLALKLEWMFRWVMLNKRHILLIPERYAHLFLINISKSCFLIVIKS